MLQRHQKLPNALSKRRPYVVKKKKKKSLLAFNIALTLETSFINSKQTSSLLTKKTSPYQQVHTFLKFVEMPAIQVPTQGKKNKKTAE